MKIIAHRGFSKEYPENTIIAFEKAMEVGVDMIETDVRLSSDNIPIIFHDEKLTRIAESEHEPESQLVHELKKLDAGRWFHESYATHDIPTLDELLTCINQQTELILEMKFRAHTFVRVCDEVEKRIHDKLEWIEVSSFDDKILERMHLLNSNIRLHKLIDTIDVLEKDNFDALYKYVKYFDIEIGLEHHPKVQKLIVDHKVIFWTVDNEDISKSINMGLYGAMSNDPRDLKANYGVDS